MIIERTGPSHADHCSCLKGPLRVSPSTWMAANVVGGKKFSKDVGWTLLGRGLAISGSLGCCSIAHDSQRLDRMASSFLPHDFVLTRAVEFRPFVSLRRH